MKNRFLPGYAWLVALGSGVVLLIGALARFDTAIPLPPATAPNPAQITEEDSAAEAPPTAHPLPSDLSPGLGDIVKLAQAHVDEGVMIAFIKSSGHVFTPTADEILYLADLGLSQRVIGAIVDTAAPTQIAQTTQIPASGPPMPMPATPMAEAPTAQPEPPPAVAESQADANAAVFYDSLSPYGTWSQQPGYGQVWKPTVETIDPNWTPYVDAGQWLYSDSGWYWQSDYTWGWAPYHYGRWVNLATQGWAWTPGNTWSPAWVTWRVSGSYVGWAPLPPGVSLNVLAQLTFNSKPVGPNFTFGLPSSAFSFVNISSLTKRRLPTRVAPAKLVGELVRTSVSVDNYSIVKNRIFNAGVATERVAAASKAPVPQVTLRATSSLDSSGLAKDKKTLAVYVPPVAAPATSSSAEMANTERSRDESSADAALARPSSPAPGLEGYGQGPAQLPPLRYSRSVNPNRSPAYNRFAAESPEAGQRWQNGPRAFANEERFGGQMRHAEEDNRAQTHPPEPPHFAPESHPSPPPAEPARAAAASASPASSSSSSKTGK